MPMLNKDFLPMRPVGVRSATIPRNTFEDEGGGTRQRVFSTSSNLPLHIFSSAGTNDGDHPSIMQTAGPPRDGLKITPMDTAPNPHSNWMQSNAGFLDSFYSSKFQSLNSPVDNFLNLFDINGNGSGVFEPSAQSTATSPVQEDRRQNPMPCNEDQRTGNVPHLPPTMNEGPSDFEVYPSVGTYISGLNYNYAQARHNHTDLTDHSHRADNVDISASSSGSFTPTTKLYQEQEKPGHDPPHHASASTFVSSHLHGSPASQLPRSSVFLNGPYVGSRPIVDGDFVFRDPMPGILQTLTNPAFAQYSTFRGQPYPNVPVFLPMHTAQHGGITITERGIPQHIAATRVPRVDLQVALLDFLMANFPTLRLVTGPNEDAMAPVMDAFQQELRRCNFVFSVVEVQELFARFKGNVGTEAGRLERDTRKVQKTKVTCPFQFCGNPFTRLSGLKNHLSAHFALTPRQCLHCGKPLSSSSHRRHQDNCSQGSRSKLSGSYRFQG